MSYRTVPRARYGEAFWWTHHEAWKRSDLNQRKYCEFHGLSLKAFGNWRAQFKAEPEAPARKLLYRRGGMSHTRGHRHSLAFGNTLSHVIYPSLEVDAYEHTVDQRRKVTPLKVGRRIHLSKCMSDPQESRPVLS